MFKKGYMDELQSGTLRLRFRGKQKKNLESSYGKRLTNPKQNKEIAATCSITTSKICSM